MCATCGCDSNGNVTMHDVSDHAHDHSHQHDHPHDHTHHKKVVDVEQDVLHQNNLLAQRNRGYFEAKNILALNLVSSPGSGKTTLLEKTLSDLKNELSCYVIEGDQQTSNDADRIHATGTPVVQINTGKGCHLDAHMILHALQHMKPKENAVMFVPFSVEAFKENAKKINPSLVFIEVSAYKGDGLSVWYNWLKQKVEQTALA